MTALTALRLSLLLVLVLLWAWAGSVFTPWAEDRDPRLWLYDTRYYTGFVLLFWGLAEAAGWWRHARRGPSVPLLLLAAVIAATTALALDGSAAGLQLKTRWSTAALMQERAGGDSERRHRAGWLLVDTRRHPCGTAPWLWLGRPFGGGTGTSQALVYAGDDVPATPDPDAFRFRPVAQGWWLAYQHADAYARGLQARRGLPCVPGQTVARHAQGLRFIAAGRDATAP